MLRHNDLWRAIDQLAHAHGLSTSGLARRAGLDATTFNRSKRVGTDGHMRWPSTESLAKILEATGTPLTEFVNLIAPYAPRRLPLIGYAQAGSPEAFDESGKPSGTAWDEIEFAGVVDSNAYALEVSGDSMDPVYREGDILIISPGAPIRRGDRVVVRVKTGEIVTKQLARETANRIELKSMNPSYPDLKLARDDVSWMARIVWVSQ